MKRVTFLLFFTLLAGLSMSAQDIITKKDGTDIKAKVLEVGTNEIMYKSFSNLDGPLYTISKSDVLMVTYENGERDVFHTDSSQSNEPSGIMTLNQWTGRLSVNGMNIDKKSTYLYFTPESEALYKSGDSLATVGDVLMGLGAGGAVGHLIGTLAAGRNIKSGAAVYGVYAGLVAIGLPFHIVGVNKINKAIADYNSKHGFAHNSPEFSVGLQNYGVGLALEF